MTDRIFNGVAILALMVLAFLAGSYAMLAQRFHIRVCMTRTAPARR